MAFIIHGATGAQGAPLLARLARSGQQVVAAVRHPSAVPAAAGISAVAVDMASADSLEAVYQGADGVFIHLPLADEAVRLQYAHHITQAIGRARPQRVVISAGGAVVDAPGSPLQAPADGAVATLIRGVQATGVSLAVVAPRVFLENLLLPVVLDAVRADGMLRYPLRADCAVSWCSHQDVADAAARLLLDSAITGVVGVGQLPGLAGPDLAAGFAQHLGRPVVFESLAPAAFGDLLKPLLGEGAAAGVVAFYQALAQAPCHVIASETSAQQLLGLQPRSLPQWLAEMGV
ncbi:MAG: NmrA family NAD(P)-binding protein [Brachymonas sp.]|nr:NmrA family NAD(P)-binding protein [Brachymonas sp.]